MEFSVWEQRFTEIIPPLQIRIILPERYLQLVMLSSTHVCVETGILRLHVKLISTLKTNRIIANVISFRFKIICYRIKRVDILR